MADEKAPMEPNDESLKELEITEDDLECTDEVARYTTMCTTFRDTVIQFKETDIDRLYSRPVSSITTEFKFADEAVESERREADATKDRGEETK
ncbi:hypothetical protein EES41_39730 (plasmid) [Streptomyces sp. ADI95-16]|uniref:hypothetical protein n=1 Tax=Streptomyces sp. ADI95-16 TaxID=1522758 RepID=UPI000F3A9F98|nr:hypothetical protein [Streptomyces sp. ADI95-16]AYV32905.1 hypothetical protein EES41_39730 [Streptomyces sp. ADI95-16]